LEGVVRTRVGYAGGRTPHPTYHNIGDHTEAVQVDYDPQRIRYADLLTFFWENHRPTSQSWRRQYLHAVFFHDALQEKEALASKAAAEKHLGEPVHTEVLPLRSFTLAEDYHQKYLLKREPDLMRELTRIYPRHDDFVNSTAAARINGYAGGYGSEAQLEQEIGSLGLSPESSAKLEMLMHHKGLFN
jgi:peptide-methionine (S)-S-oxide reductase